MTGCCIINPFLKHAQTAFVQHSSAINETAWIIGIKQP